MPDLVCGWCMGEHCSNTTPQSQTRVRRELHHLVYLTDMDNKRKPFGPNPPMRVEMTACREEINYNHWLCRCAKQECAQRNPATMLLQVKFSQCCCYYDMHIDIDIFASHVPGLSEHECAKTKSARLTTSGLKQTCAISLRREVPASKGVLAENSVAC